MRQAGGLVRTTPINLAELPVEIAGVGLALGVLDSLEDGEGLLKVCARLREAFLPPVQVSQGLKGGGFAHGVLYSLVNVEGLLVVGACLQECFPLFQVSQGLKALVRFYPRPERNTLHAK